MVCVFCLIHLKAALPVNTRLDLAINWWTFNIVLPRVKGFTWLVMFTWCLFTTMISGTHLVWRGAEVDISSHMSPATRDVNTRHTLGGVATWTETDGGSASARPTLTNRPRATVQLNNPALLRYHHVTLLSTGLTL